MNGFERLQKTVNVFSHTQMDRFDHLSSEELLTLFDAYMASDWDITPDHWTDKQVDSALAGIPPKFNDDMSPRYDL